MVKLRDLHAGAFKAMKPALILDAIFARRVGTCIYGLGVVVLGLTGLVWGDFAVVWQPDSAPGQSALGYALPILPLLVGLAMQW